jgi:solute carrier family 25 carnitine/acylcarnitine transporter 20/29
LGGPTKSEDRIFKVIDPQVVVSGFCGGVARGIVEGPFEYVKVRRQVDMPWKMREMWNGAGATVLRNSFLFGSFVIYMDISRLYIELSPFWLGSICANLAWLTIWPLDVVKTRMQSGNYAGQSALQIIRDITKNEGLGAFFKGAVPKVFTVGPKLVFSFTLAQYLISMFSS